MRVSTSPSSRKRRKRVLKQARGFRGSRSKLLRQAYVAVNREKAFAYVGRKQKKRQFRRLWIVRINIACRLRGITYSRFMHGLKSAECGLNRKILADLAVQEPEAFDQLVEKAKAALA